MLNTPDVPSKWATAGRRCELPLLGDSDRRQANILPYLEVDDETLEWKEQKETC